MKNGRELIQPFLDQELTAEEENRLSEWLLADPENLREFVRETHLHRQLREVLVADQMAAVGEIASDRETQKLKPRTGLATLLRFFGRDWLQWATAFVLLIGTIGLLLLWNSTRSGKAISRMLEEARQFAKAESVEKLLDSGFDALRDKKLEKAGEKFAEVLELSPNDAEGNYGLGEVRRQQKRPTEAEQFFRTAITAKSDYSAPHTGLGIILQERGNIEEAERLYRKAIELDSTDAAAHVNLGNLLRDFRNELVEADKLLRKALDLEPNDIHATRGLAYLRLKQGLPAEAEELLRKAVLDNPAHSSLHNELGEVLRISGQNEEAERMFREALRLDPENGPAYNNLAILYATRHEFAEAEKMFRQVLERATTVTRLPALVNLAIACGKQGNVNDAETYFRQALDISPEEPRITHAFALFLADHKLKLDEALTLAQQAVGVEPNNPDYLEALGWVLFNRGDVIAAKAILDRALTLAGDSASAISIQEHLQRVNEMSSQK